jgi:hypothetical protein
MEAQRQIAMSLKRKSKPRHSQDEYNAEIEKIARELSTANPSSPLPDVETVRILADRMKISLSAAYSAFYRWQKLRERPQPLIRNRISGEEHERRLLSVGALQLPRHLDRLEAYLRKYEDVGWSQANSAVWAFNKKYDLINH